MAHDVSSLGDEKFVSLTTWKKSGEKVSSAMWLARDGDALVMWTHADSWKVKRLRRDSRVELTPCGRTGKVDEGATTTSGSATVDADPTETARVKQLIKAKYGFEFHVITVLERIMARGTKDRVVVRISVSQGSALRRHEATGAHLSGGSATDRRRTTRRCRRACRRERHRRR